MNLEASLSKLKGTTTEALPSDAYPEPGAASVRLRFSDGTLLRVDYWRLLLNDKAGISSFDHGHKYGLLRPIDAIKHLQDQLRNKRVVDAGLEPRTGDLFFRLDEGVELQGFNLTGYEVWEIQFTDGTGEYSNYARPSAEIDWNSL
jgi:hypothetical protein